MVKLGKSEAPYLYYWGFRPKIKKGGLEEERGGSVKKGGGPEVLLLKNKK